MQALGAVMSAQLRVSLTSLRLATTVAFTIKAKMFLIVFAVRPSPLPTAEGFANMAWWATLAGRVGAAAVVAELLFVETLGAGTVSGLIVASNLIASLAIDYFRLFGIHTHPIDAARVGGAALTAGGVLLISKIRSDVLHRNRAPCEHRGVGRTQPESGQGRVQTVLARLAQFPACRHSRCAGPPSQRLPRDGAGLESMEVRVITTVSGLLGLVSQTPADAAIDHARARAAAEDDDPKIWTAPYPTIR